METVFDASPLVKVSVRLVATKSTPAVAVPARAWNSTLTVPFNWPERSTVMTALVASSATK